MVGPLPLDSHRGYAAQILKPSTRRTKRHHPRDLKPGNILLTKSGESSCWTWFGPYRLRTGRGRSTREPMLTARAVMGTPAYMSPEQWEGKPRRRPSDIYAFGCVLYELLTGQHAAEARKAVEPATVESVLRGCLEKDPEDRLAVRQRHPPGFTGACGVHGASSKSLARTHRMDGCGRGRD